MPKNKPGKIDLSEFDNEPQVSIKPKNIVENPIDLKDPSLSLDRNESCSVISEKIIYQKNKYLGVNFRTTEKNHELLKLMADLDNKSISDVGNSIIQSFFNENGDKLKEEYLKKITNKFS